MESKLRFPRSKKKPFMIYELKRSSGTAEARKQGKKHQYYRAHKLFGVGSVNSFGYITKTSSHTIKNQTVAL